MRDVEDAPVARRFRFVRAEELPAVERSVAPPDKTLSMRDAVAAFVHDGDTVCLEGFTHLIPTAAGHEIIRQRRRDLTVVRMTADIVVDQMLAGGCVKRLVSSFVGNSSAGSLGELRRRIERADPEPLEFEEYSHHGMVCRYQAGAQRLPFLPLRSYAGERPARRQPGAAQGHLPYPGPDGEPEQIYVVPPVNPDVTFIHAQRADRLGNTQIWGLTGVQAEAVYAAKRAVVVVEEIVDDEVIRADPNRTVVPTTRWTRWCTARAAPTPPSPRATTTGTTPSTAPGPTSARMPSGCAPGWTSGCTAPATTPSTPPSSPITSATTSPWARR